MGAKHSYVLSEGGELTHPVVGSEGRAVLVGTLHAMRPLLGATPFVHEGRLERLLELCSDPTLLTMGGSTVSLWGQRPV